jgi:hypothetical protein
VQDSDCVVIVTEHRNVDYQHMVDLASSVVDCCNVTVGVKGAGAKIVRLGSGIG